MTEREAWLRTLGGQTEDLHWEILRLQAEVLIAYPLLGRLVRWLCG